ncbi:protein DpdH [Actinosynnema pretiosum]|uniref:ATP-binding protein n=1 Tax=Actinosynnema pretiosum TaxID=42197 RepID=A0A290Z111_9PSEU|nr:protein DpdH [Actinosynnema pretiosum]ATE52694.1 hypothetical protein CNX65_04845 [Actinosynnema pretiosum]
MPEFSGHLCWSTKSASTAVSTEAVIPSSAVFLATHTPLRISRARVVGRTLAETDIVVSEEEVLKEFTSLQAASGALLMPVVGDSGSGKSHLVRWVKEHLTPTVHQKVIYLEKSQTSLKAVLQALLVDIEHESVDQLKRDVATFSSAVDADALARRLINALNEALAATTPNSLDGIARVLAGPRGLALILQDPHFQEHFLRPGGFIRQLANQLLHNRDGQSSDRPQGFTTEDLPLVIRDHKQAAAASLQFFAKLSAKPELHEIAVKLLNDNLEAALQAAANLGSGRLQEAFLKVRQIYAERNTDILLLVEDFALIQGVQGELLDALTEGAVRDGATRYAPIRTLMAVTTGYFKDLPETALTRIAAASGGHVFQLDITFDEQNKGTADITSFVGRYLNAARTDHEDLQSGTGSPLPNKCEDCQFRTACHAAFGTSPDGHGLYPFNESALVRAVHSTASMEWDFVPRTVLSNVVRPILIEHATSLQEGTFPDEQVRERFPLAKQDIALSTSVAQFVDSHETHDAERYKLTLEMWGNSPSRITELNKGILKAFRVSPIDTSNKPTNEPDDKRGEPGNGRTGPAKSTSASLTKKINDTEKWSARSEVLPQGTANEIRTAVTEAVSRRYQWISPPMREWNKKSTGKAWPNSAKTVSIEGAYGDNIANNPPISFKRTALNSQFFQSLLRAREGQGGRAEDIRRLARVAEKYEPSLTSSILKTSRTADSDLIIGMRASLLGAALAGHASPGMDEAGMLSTVLDTGQGWTRSDSALRVPRWNDLLANHLKNRPELVEVLKNSLGVAQGTGAVHMIDAARALPLLREAAADWSWQPEQVPDWCKKSVTEFHRFASLIDDQVRGLQAVLSNIRELLPEGTSGKETVAAVQAAIREAANVGLSQSQEQVNKLRALATQAAEAEWGKITELARDLKGTSSDESPDPTSQNRRSIAAIRDRGDSLLAIRNFLNTADSWLTPALESASVRTSPAGDLAVQEVQALLAKWSSFSTEEQS